MDAQSLDASDVGTYGVIHVDGHLTDMRFHLIQGQDRWHLEGIRDDGTWGDLTCEKECLLKVSSAREAALFARDVLPAGWEARCLHNNSFAICRMESSNGDRKYVFVALVTGTPTPLFLKPLGGG
jgi:hypothetical protein